MQKPFFGTNLRAGALIPSTLGISTWTGRGTFAPGILPTHMAMCERVILKMREGVSEVSRKRRTGIAVLLKLFSLDILDISFGELCKPTSAERRHYICLRKLNQRRCFLCCQWTQFLQFRPLTSKIELKTRQKVELRWGWKCLVGPVGLALSALPSTCVGGVPPRNPHTTISLQSTLRYNRIKQKYKHERRTRWWGEMHCAKENVVFSAPLDFKSSFGLVKNTKCGNFFHRAI